MAGRRNGEHGRLADAYIRIYVYKFAGIWPEVIEIYECQMVGGGRRLSRGAPHDGLAGNSLSRLRNKRIGDVDDSCVSSPTRPR